MNADEAKQVVNYLLAANLNYTPQPFLPADIAVWYDHLRDIPADVGAEAARQIVESDIDWPAYGRFRAVAMALKRSDSQRGIHGCECGDSGLVQVAGQTDAYRPCGRCNPAGYERWSKGKYMPRFAGTPTAAAAEQSLTNVAGLRDALDRIGNPDS